jgi:CubicO group peptidase (beta-lactamase class C family)
VKESIQVVNPEEVGIASSHLVNFLNRLERNKINMHSIILIRKGKKVLEAEYAPYTKDRPHRMFSITKSLVSLGIGMLEEEGKISLDDPIVMYFEDKLPEEGAHPYTMETTIRDMLQMTTAQSATTYKQMDEDDWVKTFFVVPPSHLPGKIFSYDTSASHVLGALIERLSGMSLLEYLRLKVLDQIGFSKEAYILKDPVGVSMGGSGLVATTEDLVKVGELLLNKGINENVSLIPLAYLEEATKKQVDTALRGATVEEKEGYGYQFWQTRNNGFMAYGMGGQYILVLPEEEMILITTADTQPNPGSNQLLFNAFWEEVYDHLSDEPLEPSKEELQRLKQKVESLTLLKEEGEVISPLEKEINKKIYTFEPNELGMKYLSFEFNQGEKYGTFTYENETGAHTLLFGLGKHIEQAFPFYETTTFSHGVWKNENELMLTHYLIGEMVGTVFMYFTFEEDSVTVLFRKVEETLFNEYAGFASGKKQQ